jgi:hypothetical protein
MRRTVAIIVLIVVGASFVPWLRHQQFFSVFVGIVAVALTAFISFGSIRALAALSERGRPQQNSTRTGWWTSRRRRLLLGAGLVLLLMLTAPHFGVTSNGAYKLAVATAHHTPQFNESLGTPITEGWYSEGKIVWGNPATAELVIPVRGQLRKGNLRALAIKDGGGWRLKELTLELTLPDERMDLLSRSDRPNSGVNPP